MCLERIHFWLVSVTTTSISRGVYGDMYGQFSLDLTMDPVSERLSVNVIYEGDKDKACSFVQFWLQWGWRMGVVNKNET